MVHTFKHSQVLDVPVDKVFPVFADVTGLGEFHPSIASVDLLTPGQKTGAGAKRRCNFKDNSSVVEECMASETNKLVQMNLAGPGFPIKTLNVFFRFEDKGAQTVVTMEMQTTMRMGPIGWLMAKTVIPGKLKSVQKMILDALNEYSKTPAFQTRGQGDATPVVAINN